MRQPCIIDGVNWTDLFYISDDGEAIIRDRSCGKRAADPMPENLTIPSSIAGYPVTRVSDGLGIFKLKNVVIPDSVRYIDEFAFGSSYYKTDEGRACHACQDSLESVVIGAGVTNVASFAFGYCQNLTTVTIRKGNKGLSFGRGAFRNCKKLKQILDNGCNWSCNIADTFAGCDSYHDGGGFRIIGGVLERYCGEEKDVVIPAGVTRIWDHAFKGKTRIKTLEIPEGVTTIGYRAFADCKALQKVTIPQSVETIGGEAFRDCVVLHEVNLCNADTEIKDNAFYGCKNLEYVETPEAKIGRRTWNNMTTLKD